MAEVKLKLDVISGVIEIEANAEIFDSVATRAAELLISMRTPGFTDSAGSEIEPEIEAPVGTGEESFSQQSQPKKAAQVQNKTKRKGPAKAKSLRIVDDLLTDIQRRELKEFYEEKLPTS